MVEVRIEHLISFLICVLGILSNTLSLTYFLKRESRGLINTLFILLTTSDLGVCLFGTLSIVTATRGFHDNPPYLIFKTMFSFSIQGTGLATVLISVCRALKICRPLDNNVRGRKVAMVTALTHVVGFFIELLDAVVSESCEVETLDRFRDYKRYYYIMCSITAVLIILTANFLTVRVLKKTKRESVDKYAGVGPTVTIIILSTIFCFISVLVLIHLFLLVFHVKDDHVTIYFFFHGIPLNSAVNPLVYISRNRSMFMFVKAMFCGCGTHQQGILPTRHITPILDRSEDRGGENDIIHIQMSSSNHNHSSRANMIKQQHDLEN